MIHLLIDRLHVVPKAVYSPLRVSRAFLHSVIDINDLLGLNSKPKSPTIPTVSQANLVSTPNAASLKETSSFIELLKYFLRILTLY